MKAYVYINGTHPTIYNLLQGTRHGGIHSRWLFLVYINDLISDLEKAAGEYLCITSFMVQMVFADDLTVLSRLKAGLNFLAVYMSTPRSGEYTVKNGISNLYILLKSALKIPEMPFHRPSFQNISGGDARTP